jgi:alpha-glucosidase
VRFALALVLLAVTAPAAGAQQVDFAAGLGQVGLEFDRAGVAFSATHAESVHRDAAGYTATLATTDPAGGTIEVRVTPTDLTATGPADADSMAASFARAPGERFLGFGERSDAVVRDAGTVSNRVSEGPYQDVEQPFIAGFVPPAGYNPRHDASYFPIPWILSTRGYGLLIREDRVSRFVLGDPWRAEVDGPRLSYRVYAGPRPADALRRFTADTGRQPPAAAPMDFGAWWQPSGDLAQNIATLQRAGALGSVVQTYTHYLPCAAQAGRADAERAQTARAHAAGLAITTYFNPMICTGHPRYAEAAARGLLTKDPTGRPYVYRYTGSTEFLVSQVDFTAPGASAFYGDLLAEAVANGYDGWMEDFGEYTPDDARSADGTPGAEMHNRYPALYHGGAYAYAHGRAPRPLARFNRSGWTGAAAASQLVWGGDPTTGWGFDGLASAVRNGLSIGLSGVSLWGSDIGGYFALSEPQTTPDLLRRWIEFGFASGVMRTQANGFSLASSPRAQIFDADVLPVWVRYARLRTQLYPYLAAAEREYDATGLPLMRALALAYPGDPRAVAREDEYLLGPDLLVAPVLEPGATQRRLYLPRGRWIDFWRGTAIDGGRDVVVPAPADRLPLFVRGGAVIGLLPDDVQTLSPYGPALPARRTVMAWPARGLPSSRTSLDTDGSAVRSGMHRTGTWVLRVHQRRRRRLDLQVALARRPCRLLVAGRRARFAYARGVLRASVRLRSGTILARARCHGVSATAASSVTTRNVRLSTR